MQRLKHRKLMGGEGQVSKSEKQRHCKGEFRSTDYQGDLKEI